MDQYKCQSYYDDDNVLQDCTCGKCGEKEKPLNKYYKGEAYFDERYGIIGRCEYDHEPFDQNKFYEWITGGIKNEKLIKDTKPKF